MDCALLLSSLSLLWILSSTSMANQSCGNRPLVGLRGSRIIGGTDAKPGTWPWLVSLQQPSGTIHSHTCGATLFSTEWVVTAAHCFKGEDRNIFNWRVVTGATRLSELGPETQVRKFKKLHRHEHYNPKTEKNDIALIQLDKPIVFNDHTQPACFPDSSLDVPKMAPCHVSGWGVTEEGSNEPADNLQEARVNMIPLDRCNSSEWYDGSIGDYNLCAGYETGGIDSCQGDSGGPLMCKDEHSLIYYVVGVTSWGRGCAQAQSPGVYSSTQYFLDWILKSIPHSSSRPSVAVPTGSVPEPTNLYENTTEESAKDSKPKGEAKEEILHGEAGTSHGEAGTSHGKAGTSHGKAGTSHGKAGTSHGEAGTPHSEEETPHGEAETPHGEAETPHGEEGTPHGEAGTPHGKAETLDGEAGTPHGEAGTPDGEEGTSDGEEGTPRGEEETPDGEEGTSHGEAGTPHGEVGTSDGKKGPSQHEQTTSQSEKTSQHEESSLDSEETEYYEYEVYGDYRKHASPKAQKHRPLLRGPRGRRFAWAHMSTAAPPKPLRRGQ